MRETHRSAPGLKEAPVQRGEQPGLHLGSVAELFTFGLPDEKSLLREIPGICFGVGQAISELIKRLIIPLDEVIKLQSEFANALPSKLTCLHFPRPQGSSTYIAWVEQRPGLCLQPGVFKQHQCHKGITG